MSDLPVPDGWTATTLGALGRYLNGRAFKSSEWSKRGRPIIRIQDLTGSNKNPNYFEGEVEDRYVVRRGDFLISWSATLGAYIWDGPEGVLNQHIFKVESKIDKRFHYHLVRERIAELERNAHGSGMVHITKGLFESTPVAIPEDANTQAAIAELIDLLVAKQQSATQHFARARRTVERFRRALLAVACSGRLTADWREENPETSSVEDLIVSARSFVASQNLVRRQHVDRSPRVLGRHGIPPSWRWTPVRDIAVVVSGQTARGTDAWVSSTGDYPWLKIADMNVVGNERSMEVATRWLSRDGVRQLRLRPLPPGTIVFPKRGGAIATNKKRILKRASCVDLNTMALVPFEPVSQYIWWWFNSVDLGALADGSNVPQINHPDIEELLVPIPPVEEQRQITRRVDHLFQISNQLEVRVEAASTRIERIAQAILAKALRGELHATEEA